MLINSYTLFSSLKFKERGGNGREGEERGGKGRKVFLIIRVLELEGKGRITMFLSWKERKGKCHFYHFALYIKNKEKLKCCLFFKWC